VCGLNVFEKMFGICFGELKFPRITHIVRAMFGSVGNPEVYICFGRVWNALEISRVTSVSSYFWIRGASRGLHVCSGEFWTCWKSRGLHVF
jgi:hypothetical protein